MYIHIYIYIYISEYRNTVKMHKKWKQSSLIKQLLETLFLAIKMWTVHFTTNDKCMNTMCAQCVQCH